MKVYLYFCIAVCVTLSGCSGGTVNTAVNNAPSTPADKAAGGPTSTPASSANQNSPDPKPSPEDEGGDRDAADFAGTAGITDKKNANIKAVAIMSDVRTARHGNYDRIVFEFLGPDMPTYHLEYIDKPVRSCGSGDTVPLAGDGWLEVRFTDAQAHTPEGAATIKDRQRSPNLPILKDLKITCDFEAEVTWVAGVSSPNKYRVIELKDPTRLAVDVKHASEPARR